METHQMKTLVTLAVFVLVLGMASAASAGVGSVSARDITVDTALFGTPATAGESLSGANLGNGLPALDPNGAIDISSPALPLGRGFGWINDHFGDTLSDGTKVNGDTFLDAQANGGVLPDDYPDVISHGGHQ